MSVWRNVATRWVALESCLGLLLIALAGCGSTSVKTYPVKAKVEAKDADVALLTGGHVELMHEGQPEIRPSGRIQPGGGFVIETLHQGKIVSGAPEGKYKVRIILGDQSDADVPKRKGDPIHKRFLDFETSGLSLTVPAGNYSISVSKK